MSTAIATSSSTALPPPTNPNCPWRKQTRLSTAIETSQHDHLTLDYATCRYLAWVLWSITPWRFDDQPLSHWRAKLAAVSTETIERLLGVWEH